MNSSVSSAVRALSLEYKSLQEEPVEGFRVKVNDENLFEWHVSKLFFDKIFSYFFLRIFPLLSLCFLKSPLFTVRSHSSTSSSQKKNIYLFTDLKDMHEYFQVQLLFRIWNN